MTFPGALKLFLDMGLFTWEKQRMCEVLCMLTRLFKEVLESLLKLSTDFRRLGLLRARKRSPPASLSRGLGGPWLQRASQRSSVWTAQAL